MKTYNGIYADGREERIVYPLGGIGAGMIGLEGTGALSNVSLRGKPDLLNQPLLFSTLTVLGEKPAARILEGPVPEWKVFDFRNGPNGGAAGGQNGRNYGLPRMKSSSFISRFPFATIELADSSLPVSVSLQGWSPFIPSNADHSSLPVAGLEYTFRNESAENVDIVYSFHTYNFMSMGLGESAVRQTQGGFVLSQSPAPGQAWAEGAFCAAVDQPNAASVHTKWFRGPIWYDEMTMLWKTIEAGGQNPVNLPEGEEEYSGPGGSLYVPLQLKPGEAKRICLRLSWYVPVTDQRHGPVSKEIENADDRYHIPWYAGKFSGIEEVDLFWREHYMALRGRTDAFTKHFYSTDVPDEILEAVSANLSILKSPTVMRQKDGRLWAWEGSFDMEGSCYGTCTHVWNYAQGLPHLFPVLERGMRQSELTEGQNEAGHQAFRLPLPIQPAVHHDHSAADGQLGGIMKVYREWRISGDIVWLRMLWPKIETSLHYAMETWDPDRHGVLVEPHHNTYDIEFWGPDPMCSSIYLGALKAASLMSEALEFDGTIYAQLYRKGRSYMENILFNGEYFEQQTMWEGLRAEQPTAGLDAGNVQYSPEAYGIYMREGPKYQYTRGCLADGLLGAWLAENCGLGEILDPQLVKSHLLSVYKHNFRADLSEHVNPQRPGFAFGRESGLLLCTWPRGGEPTLPLQYSHEVWSGIEYQVASHLLLHGCREEALKIVRSCRDRYDGRIRNPFAEYECGLWYGRAMASYALFGAYYGIRYDAVEKTLYMRQSAPDNFSSFIAVSTGFGTVGRRGGVPFAEMAEGFIDIMHYCLE
ncbi:GH116 family glycosyl hydrolase [Paenibacillus nasutitermitis]|uniref:Uncharacterized protein n=1 Tax=Paenibacillus nasutitermitis TaxID=1652958 RepID=A0A917DP03_9BACL|nr:GH116 family glycosyl hydrolase [Paenibacillus nasutitermitis]GGD57188.1 hypothetical protein GCM10010911_13710 [Paenibacillus nasutitermitis]